MKRTNESAIRLLIFMARLEAAYGSIGSTQLWESLANDAENELERLREQPVQQIQSDEPSEPDPPNEEKPAPINYIDCDFDPDRDFTKRIGDAPGGHQLIELSLKGDPAILLTSATGRSILENLGHRSLFKPEELRSITAEEVHRRLSFAERFFYSYKAQGLSDFNAARLCVRDWHTRSEAEGLADWHDRAVAQQSTPKPKHKEDAPKLSIKARVYDLSDIVEMSKSSLPKHIRQWLDDVSAAAAQNKKEQN